jgi:hypothetical protein
LLSNADPVEGETMTLQGTVVNGTIVLDDPTALRIGARVEVVIQVPAKAASPLGEMLLKHAGKAQGLPEDMAAQHDHYLHGTPWR